MRETFERGSIRIVTKEFYVAPTATMTYVEDMSVKPGDVMLIVHPVLPMLDRTGRHLELECVTSYLVIAGGMRGYVYSHRLSYDTEPL